MSVSVPGISTELLSGRTIICGKLTRILAIALVLAPAGTGAAQNIDPALVGWWTFDEGAGNVAGEPGPDFPGRA